MDLAIEFAQSFERNDILNQTIFYECRDGKSMTDSPYAIFKYLVTNPHYKDYIHIWSVDESAYGWDIIMQKYADNENVKFVKRNTTEYLFYLTSSKFLFTNSTFQSYFIPKKEQVCINTWHGIPIKKMGYDIQSGNPAGLQNVVRNFFFSNVLVSPDKHMTNMYKHSFKLDGAYTGKIAEIGYPRIDLTNLGNKETIIQELLSENVQIEEDKKIILYCPTWKGANVNNPSQELQQIIQESQYIRDEVHEEYNLLVKVHPFIYAAAQNHSELKQYLIPDYFDANEVMSCVDVLITDYSSIFFDFLKTKKPIIFYCWDKEIYESDRGLYISEDRLPGPVVKTVAEVVAQVKDIEKVNKDYQDNYQKMLEDYLPYEDGHSTQRLVDYVLGNNYDITTGCLVDCKDLAKQTVLLYVGGMKNNGITSSVVNLLKNMDYTKYDVTCFTGYPRTKQAISNILSVPDEVRFIYKPGYAILNPTESKNLRKFNKLSNQKNQQSIPWQGLQREADRIFSNRTFDIAIDFSGYSFFWAKYIIASNSNKKICFLHSDMLADKNREVNGKKIHEKNLLSLFYNYNQFDKLLTVSPVMKKVNKKNLQEFIQNVEISYTINTLDIAKLFGEEVEEIETSAPTFSYENIDLVCENSKFYLYDSWDSEVAIEMLSPWNSSIKAIMSVELENETRYKVLMDYIYIGWVSSLQFTQNYFQVEEIKQVNEYGYVKGNKSRFLWIDLPVFKEARLVGKVEEYRYLLMNIDKKAKLNNGQWYLHLVRDGEALGWVEKASISPVKDGIFLRRMKNKFTNRKKLQKWDNRILETIHQEGFVQLHSLPYEDQWDRSIVFRDLSTPLNDFLGKPFKYSMKVNTKDGWYFRLWGKNFLLGWVSQRNIKKITQQRIIFSNDMSGTVTLKFPLAYYSIDKSDQVELEDTIFSVQKRIITTNETFYLIDSYLLVPQDNVEKIDNHEKDHLSEEKEKMITDGYNIVTMGRLSPEKKQDNLIKAFSKINKLYPESKLYLLGDGPLKKKLIQLVQDLGLTDSVYLLGHQDNPFELLRQCQLFVLTSDYEGQPMVLLEAMAVGLPVAATDIPATRYVLDNGNLGLLAKDNSISGIESMLEKAYETDLSAANFNAYEYNKKAVEMFYQEIEGSNR
ncbi:MAG: CDP-glycerol glycerophosphotransferase family protein [Tetragenococcus koreensis]|nr:CDP-glycerol glycerophosphotransferase family protein [Tetragenococcus koreensis]